MALLLCVSNVTTFEWSATQRRYDDEYNKVYASGATKQDGIPKPGDTKIENGKKYKWVED